MTEKQPASIQGQMGFIKVRVSLGEFRAWQPKLFPFASYKQ